MRKNKRKDDFGYTFLEVFLSLSILGLFLGLLFAFPLKSLNCGIEKRNELISVYRKLVPYIQKSLGVRLTEEGLWIKINNSTENNQWRCIRFFYRTYTGKRNVLDFLIKKNVQVKWLYEDEKSALVALEIGKMYENIRFLKLVFMGEYEVLEQFVFACFAR